MSFLGELLDACLAVGASALPGATVQRGLTPISGLTPVPRVLMGYAIEAPAAELAHLQERRSPRLGLWLVEAGRTQEEAYADADALRTALYADRSLGGLADSLFVENVEPFEHVADGRVSILLTVAVRRVVAS